MKYYCIGIKGSGMSTLAQLLSDLGEEVSGYDDAREYKYTEPGLEKRNIPIYYDHDHALDPSTIVTWSVAFRMDHPEIKRLKDAGFTLKRYNEIIGEVIERHHSISVSGTHGKTTTSAMISHVLEEKGCNYFIGDGSGYAKKENPLFVVESDEFNRHFLAYHPNVAVITNIELEHTECYKDLDDIVDTFTKFANQTKELVVACKDNENIRSMKFHTPVIYYGMSEDADFVAKSVTLTEEGSTFNVYKKGTLYGHFSIPLYGEHMVLNALACIAVCDYEGMEAKTIQEKLLTFHNAKRRFEETIIKDNIVIDDYAHHPTEITSTLKAVRQKYPDRKIVAIFRPNTYSRTEAFQKEFGKALDLADISYVTEIESNREQQEDYPDVSSELILKHNEKIKKFDSFELLTYHHAVICFLSCASITDIKESYLKNYQSGE